MSTHIGIMNKKRAIIIIISVILAAAVSAAVIIGKNVNKLGNDLPSEELSSSTVKKADNKQKTAKKESEPPLFRSQLSLIILTGIMKKRFRVSSKADSTP